MSQQDIIDSLENLKLTDKLDKFYTKPNIVDLCIDNLLQEFGDWKWDLVIEPSAGSGNFLIKIPCNKIGMDICPDIHQDIHPDIAPESNEITKIDFLEYKPHKKYKNILTLGNPPFGRVSSMAIKFFNHAARFSNDIAFILPRTFRKTSVKNKLNKYFHLIRDIDIPLKPCSFEPKLAVKCCFQIWTRMEKIREFIELPTQHSDWDFLKYGPLDDDGQPTPPTGRIDFVVRAYGGKCGEIKTTGFEVLRPKSWHWIKCNIDKNLLIERFSKLDFKNSLNTARQNSCGKAELIELYVAFLNS